MGGKTRLLPEILSRLPTYSGYVEPFLGGGAVFFALAPESATLSDVNPHLVTTYIEVRDRVDDVLTLLREYQKAHGPGVYGTMRDRYNYDTLTDTERAALFLYLNRTCFNGLHRVNKKGEFNSPEGDSDGSDIVDETTLRSAAYGLRNADIYCRGFEAMTAVAGNFVYLDPPYVPVSATSAFTGYAGEFGMREQTQLRDFVNTLTDAGVKVLLSNSDAPAVHELYQNYHIDRILAPRSINADGDGRGDVWETLVRNYEYDAIQEPVW